MRTDEAAHVLGLDIGGTASRAVIADLSGRTVGTGHAGGGNPNSHPPEQAVSEIGDAVRQALGETDPSSIRAGVFGMAGVSKLSDPSVAALFERTWSSLGLTCPMRGVTDCEVAFAAGTDAPSGTALIAGTGSIAARVEQHELVSTVGGHGWLLGDEGSAFWLGREAVRETLRGLDAREPDVDELASGVLSHLVGDSADSRHDVLRKQLITAANAQAPVLLAELAPIVTAAAEAGRNNAIDIVGRAAGFLADTATATRASADTSPVVIAGSVLAEDNPVGAAFRAEMAERGHGKPLAAGPGAGGAAWLALLDVLGHDVPTDTHARLVDS